LYDVKAIDEDVHIKCTGHSNKIILENLKYLDSKNCKIEVRYPYVPNYNDSQVYKIGEFLSNLNSISSIKVLPYHNLAGSKYQSLDMVNTLPLNTPIDAEILNAEKILASYGLIVKK
jgi:pyruvate formate lyase activating enzyme